MSLPIDNSSKHAGIGANFNLGGLEGSAGTAKGIDGGSSRVLDGEAVTISERGRDVTAAGGKDVAGTSRRDEQTEEAIQSLLQSAEQTDAIVDDLKALAEQMGQPVPPDGTPAPKVEAGALKEMVSTSNAMFGTSLGDGFIGAMAAGTNLVTGSPKPAESPAPVQLGESAATEKRTADPVTTDVVAAAPHTVSDAMFSIYELISLMQEIGQSQRDAARDLRETELACSLASIDLQASMQRDAATWGLIATVVTCSMQICMTVASAATAVSGGGDKAKNTGGGQDLEQNSNTVENLQAGTEGVASENTQAIENRTTEANKQAVEEAWRDSGCEEAKADYETACQTKTELEANKKDIVSTLEEMKKVNVNDLPDEEKAGHLETMKALESEVAELDTQIKDAGSQVEAAKGNYKSCLKDAMNKMQGEYDTASSNTRGRESKTVNEKKTATRAENKQNVADQKQALSEQKDVGQQRTLMEAKVIEARCAIGDAPTEAEVSTAMENYAKTESTLKFDKTYQAAHKSDLASSQVASGVLQQLSQTIGALGQSISQGGSQMIQSEATAETANQKEMDARRDETNDLYKQSGDLLNNARQLLQSVVQSESSSVEQIIRA